ncbi:MAG: ABC transporter permease, partial [Eubacterium sp.]
MPHKKYWKFIGTYLFRVVTLMIAVSIVAFVLVNLSPIDPVQKYVEAVPGVTAEQRANIEEYWGLNEPPVERYFSWANAMLHGDFGTSIIYRRPVIEIIGEKFVASLALMMTAWAFSGIFGFAMGSLMGAFKGRMLDRILKRICLTLCAIPTFWIGIVLIMIFSVGLGWFPIGMAVPPGVAAADVTIWERIHHLIL